MVWNDYSGLSVDSDKIQSIGLDIKLADPLIHPTRPYAATGKLSVGGEVLKELKEVMPEYEKGTNNIFLSLSQQIEFAKENATRSLKCAKGNHTDNPSTSIHDLIDYLQNLKS